MWSSIDILFGGGEQRTNGLKEKWQAYFFLILYFNTPYIIGFVVCITYKSKNLLTYSFLNVCNTFTRFSPIFRPKVGEWRMPRLAPPSGRLWLTDLELSIFILIEYHV